MAKQITQETFDAVVKENIEEFDMQPEEALNEAVEQFEAQGVNLANIVKELSLYSDNNGVTKHPVVTSIEDLCEEVSRDLANKNSVTDHLNRIQTECDIDLARRCLAGKNGAYAVLLSACKKFHSDSELLKACLITFCSLCNGQPDLLDEDGIMWTCGALKSADCDAKISALLVKLVKLNCVKHEKNRQKYVACDIIAILSLTMDRYKTNPDVLKEVCSALRTLTNDDDIRVPFGKAHDHAKMIVTEENALKKIMDICNDHKNNESLLGELYLTLSRLAVRNEFCQEIMDLGGLKLMVDTIRNNVDRQALIKQVLGVLKAIAGNDKVKIAIVQADGLELIIDAMNKHARSSAIAEMGCAALTTIALRNPAHSARIMAADGAETIVKAMQLHKDKEQVQKNACMAIRNTVARCREYCEIFIELGAEELIQDTITNHASCLDEAKAALRDLDLKVELRVPWTGEGKGVQR